MLRILAAKSNGSSCLKEMGYRCVTLHSPSRKTYCEYYIMLLWKKGMTPQVITFLSRDKLSLPTWVNSNHLCWYLKVKRKSRLVGGNSCKMVMIRPPRPDSSLGQHFMYAAIPCLFPEYRQYTPLNISSGTWQYTLKFYIAQPVRLRIVLVSQGRCIQDSVTN